MLLTLAEGISQLKWIHFQRTAKRLSHFQAFDEASRGPWGALKLISTTAMRTKIIYLGAIVVILSLAIDPFVQQILTYRTEMVRSSKGVASIGKADAFDSGSGKNPLYPAGSEDQSSLSSSKS